MSNWIEELNQLADIGIRKMALMAALVESVDAQFFEIDGIDQECESGMSES